MDEYFLSVKLEEVDASQLTQRHFTTLVVFKTNPFRMRSRANEVAKHATKGFAITGQVLNQQQHVLLT